MPPKLKQLNLKDLQILQSALIDLYSDVSQSTLPARTIKFAETIIPDAFVSFDMFEENKNLTRVLWSNCDLQKPTAKDMEFYNQHIHENPLHTEVVVKKRSDPVILSDFIATEDFVRTNVYKGFHSLVEAKFMMAISLWISSEAMMTCIFWSGKNDFSERDRSMLAEAAPHLINAVRNASDFNHLTAALEVKNSGVLTVDGDGQIQTASEFVRQIWHKYFSGEVSEGAKLPETVLNWVKDNKSSPNENEAPDFNLKNGQGELSIRFVTDNRNLEKTLLFEEKRIISAQTLETLNLTRREAEVLFLIAQGKSDKDIAQLCKISPLTIYKHAQNIYNKLGVETRTAAMLIALAVL